MMDCWSGWFGRGDSVEGARAGTYILVSLSCGMSKYGQMGEVSRREGIWACGSRRVYEQAGRWTVGVRAVWRQWQWTVMAPGTGWEHVFHSC